jgi:hypothetical protein
MLDGILFWLSRNINKFETPLETKVKSKTPESISPDLSRKAFCELGLVLRLAQRSPILRESSEIKKIKFQWLAILEKQDFFFDTRRRIQLFPHRVIAFAVMKSFGIVNNKVFENLQTVMQRGYMDSVERSAWEKLDMKYYIEAAGLVNCFPSYTQLYQQSSLRQLPLLSYAQNMDLYGLTHLIFHFSDFGQINIKSFMGDDFQGIQNYVDLSLAFCLIKQDWDLVAELLINQHCLGKKFTNIDVEAANIFRGIQQTSGFIPGRDWVNNQHKNNYSNKEEHDFADVYHPTLLGFFLLVCEFNR